MRSSELLFESEVVIIVVGAEYGRKAEGGQRKQSGIGSIGIDLPPEFS